MIREMYGTPKSHDLRTVGPDGKERWRYGFHGLALKPGEAKGDNPERAERLEMPI